jgi:hypothetical protein
VTSQREQASSSIVPSDEARRLFRAVFHQDPPDLFVQWFTAVPRSVFPPLDPAAEAHYSRVLNSVGDLEALEYFSRFVGRNRLLTLKLRLTVYLAECCPEVRGFFVNRADKSGVRVWLKLAGAKLRNAWKLIKGLFLFLRYAGP